MAILAFKFARKFFIIFSENVCSAHDILCHRRDGVTGFMGVAMKIEELLKQSAIDRHTDSSAISSAIKAADAIAMATSPLQRIAEEQQSLIGSLNTNCFQQIARQMGESIIASRGFEDLIGRSITQASSSIASTHLAEVLKGINKVFLEGFKPPNVSNMIADIVGRTNSFNAMESVFREHRERMKGMAEQMQNSFKSSLAEVNYFRRPDFESVSPSHLYQSSLQTHFEGGAHGFMQTLTSHIEKAKEEAGETGGRLVVKCKTPKGDDILVSQLSMEDSYFITVIGIDEHKQQRSFKGHFNAIAISIEVIVPDDDENEAEDEMPVN